MLAFSGYAPSPTQATGGVHRVKAEDRFGMVVAIATEQGKSDRHGPAEPGRPVAQAAVDEVGGGQPLGGRALVAELIPFVRVGAVGDAHVVDLASDDARTEPLQLLAETAQVVGVRAPQD